MTTTLTHILPAVTGAGVNAEFPGRLLPALNDGLFVRRLPESCQDCALKVTHKVYEAIGIQPVEDCKLYQQELIDIANGAREWIRKAQSLIQLCSRETDGIFYAEQEYLIGLDKPSVYVGGWELVSIGSHTATVRYVTGSTDPRHVTWTTYAANPDYGSIDGEGNPEPAYIGTVNGGALPARGIMTLNSESALRYHGGWIVRRIQCDDAIAIGGTFELILDTPISAKAAANWPGSSGTITVNYQVYAVGEEQWTHPRDAYPLWCVRKEVFIAAPAAEIITLEAAARVRAPSATATWFRAWKLAVGGGWTEINLDSKLKIEHDGAGYKTILDLTGYDVAGITVLRLCYFVESTSNSAICAGQDRCKWSYFDPTGSWGTYDSSNRWFYCQSRGALKALGEAGSAFIAAYKPACYQTKCPLWAEDTPLDNPLVAAAMQLTHSLPWLVVQLAPGYDDYALLRWGVPSLLSLVGLPMIPPAGYHAIRSLALHTGTWPTIKVWTEATWEIAHGLPGLEFLTLSDAGISPDLINPSTWPNYGPGGNHWTRKLDYGTANAADGNDPHHIARSLITASGVETDAYIGSQAGMNGRFQRFRTFKFFIPKIAAGYDEIAFNGGTFQRGAWSATYEPLTPGDPQTVYYWKIQLARLGNYGGAAGSVTIKHLTVTAGIASVRFQNRVIGASSLVSAQTEYASNWKQGGTNVAAPDWWRVKNYACSQATFGPGRAVGYVDVGSALKFDDAAIPASAPIKNRQFLVRRVEACVAGDKDDYRPTVQQETKTGQGPGWFWQPFNTTVETLVSIVVTRDSGGTTLKKVTGATRPHDMVKDLYWYFETTDAGGAKGVLVVFSPKNQTGTAADQVLHIVVTGNIDTYTTDLNLATDGTYGWDNTQTLTITSAVIITSLDAVIIQTLELDTNNQFKTYTLTEEASAPTNWATWDRLKYYIVSGTNYNQVIKISPEWALDLIKVTFGHGAPLGTEDAYYDSEIKAPHTLSLPAGHKATANNTDLSEVVDENGAIAAYLAAYGATAFDGMVISFRSDPRADPAAANKVWISDRVTDLEFQATWFTAWWATGEIWGKVLQPADHSLIVEVSMADGSGWPLAVEFDSIRQTLEAIFS